MQTQPDESAAALNPLRLIDELESLVENGKSLPLTFQKLVSEEEFFILTQKLKMALPKALEAAQNNSAKEEMENRTPIPRLHRDNALLLIVDVQQRLMPAIYKAEHVEKNCALLARAARQLGLPILVTEQNPEKLGATLDSVREAAGFPTAISKMLFSACTEESWRAIENSNRHTILLCGVESHVCVLQTALDLRAKNFQVFAVRDAISSRTSANDEVGWQRMMGAGVLPTSTESAIFETLQEAGTPDFRAILPFLK